MSIDIKRSMRITVGISLVLVLMQGGLSYLIVEQFRSAIRQNLDKQQFALVTTMAREVDVKIQQHLRLVEGIDRQVPSDGCTDATRAAAFLKTHGEASAFFDRGLAIFTPQGELVSRFPAGAATRQARDFSHGSHIKAVIAHGKPAVSQPYVSTTSAEPVLVFAAPVLNKDGTLRGIVGGKLGLLHDNFLGSIARARVGSSGYLYLFGRDRTMIVHPNRSRILKGVAPQANRLLDRALNGFEGTGETVNSKGVTTLSSFRALNAAPWILAANFPVQEAYGPLRTAIRNLTLALSFTIFGSCLALYVIGRRMKGEVARRAEAEDYAGLLLRSVGEGVIGVTEAGAITFANQAALKLLGFDAEADLLGHDVREILHHTHADCPCCPAGTCRIYPSFASGTSRQTENESLFRKDGSRFVADLSCTPVWGDAKLHGAVLTFRDTTERRETQERLRLQAAALEAAASSILITDHADRIIWVNQAFTRLTGYGQEQAVGQNPMELLSGRDDPELFDNLRETIRGKNAWHGQLVSRRSDGTLYDEEVTITPVLDEMGEITNFVGIMQDVTARKQAEEALRQSNLALAQANRQMVQAIERAEALAQTAERASRAKDEFLARMSHEIRTPMNGVIGVSHLLGHTRLTQQQKDYLHTLTVSAESLLGIINDILDFSKIEAGKLEIERVEFSLEEVIREIMASLAVRAEEKGLKLRTELDPALPRWLVGDPLRLSQILNNLVGNALKFTLHGGITLSVTRSSAGGGELEFSVRDTGIGIRAEDRARLFQAFSQLDGSITRTYGGTGLGLAICKQLITLMEGEIWCVSAPGMGSTFSFRLPFGVATGREAAALAGAPSAEARFSGQQILLVEDNGINQIVVAALLEKGGLQVTIAGNGAEALELVSRRSFDLVLMDIQMPVMDGLTAARQIRTLPDPCVAALPILAISANVMAHDVQECLDAGMNGHINKPVTPDTLYGAIGYWLQKTAGAPLTVADPGPGTCSGSWPASPPRQGLLDVELGIRQIGGDRNLYRDLLGRFLGEYDVKGAEVRREVSDGNLRQAAHLAHSVKGIAGVLAALQLQSVAQRLEAALKEETSEVEPLVAEFQQVLATTLVSVREQLDPH